MKYANTNRLVSRLVVSLLIKFEWAAHCGIGRRSNMCFIVTQPRTLNINLKT
jgi:hypothetical protein